MHMLQACAEHKERIVHAQGEYTQYITLLRVILRYLTVITAYIKIRINQRHLLCGLLGLQIHITRGKQLPT